MNLGPAPSGGRLSRPLRVAALVSATGANLKTLLDLQQQRPDLLEVVLVASDRTECGALEVARAAGLRVWTGDLAAQVGGRVVGGRVVGGRGAAAGPDRELASRRFHDRLNARLDRFQAAEGDLDLIVLAYHRWIHGELLDAFTGRMINQHPGDLASLTSGGERALIGMDPVGAALRRGDRWTRTSTFLVDRTHDGGAVLVQGPLTPYTGPVPVTPEDASRHERVQKQVSDPWALRAAVEGWAGGRFALHPQDRHPDGSHVVLVDGSPTPLGGLRIDPQPGPAPSVAVPIGGRVPAGAPATAGGAA